MKHLGNLQHSDGAKHKKKRIGRGPGSGHGGTATRGHKGQLSRSGATVRRGFEGGQMPIARRLPKFGFTNIFKKSFQIVNLSQLQSLIDNSKLNAEKINVEDLVKLGVIKKTDIPVKILGNGELKKALTIEANCFTKSAVTKIEAAGGAAVVNG